METVYGLLVTAALTLLTSWLITVLWRRRFLSMEDPSSTYPLPPGSMGWPLVGETIEFLLKGSDFYVDRKARWGSIYKTHLLGSPTVRLCGADYWRMIMEGKEEKTGVYSPRSVAAVFGPTSIVNIGGEAHKNLKTVLVKGFSTTRLADYVPTMQRLVRQHLMSWCGRGEFLGFPACQKIASDTTLELVLGCTEENDPDGEVRAAFQTVNSHLFTAALNLPGTPFYKCMKARQVIEQFVQKKLVAGGNTDFVSIMEAVLAGHGAEQGATFTKQHMVDNGISFLVAGSGTTSSVLCCALLELYTHPEVLSRLRVELDDAGLLTSSDSSDLNYDVVNSLPYVRCIEKEILRLRPPVGGVFRRAKETIEVGGYQIPKDWRMILSIRETHQSSPVFDDVNAFQPERWEDPDLEKRLRTSDQYNYLPFGRGIRSCLGKRLAELLIRVYLIEVARLCNWQVHKPFPTLVYLPVTKPKDDLPVTFWRRP